MRKLLVTISILLIIGCGTSPEMPQEAPKPKLTKILVSMDETGHFRVHELTDPANGERFLIVTSYYGISITPANPPIPPAAVTAAEH